MSLGLGEQCDHEQESGWLAREKAGQEEEEGCPEGC
jgi:hypothetical protein